MKQDHQIAEVEISHPFGKKNTLEKIPSNKTDKIKTHFKDDTYFKNNNSNIQIQKDTGCLNKEMLGQENNLQP